MQFFNSYRTGLRAFLIKTRDGHPAGYLWAMTLESALNRAPRLAGDGATADYANLDSNPDDDNET
jgi:hypothetical protein